MVIGADADGEIGEPAFVGPFLIGLGVGQSHARQADLAVLVLREPQHGVQTDRDRLAILDRVGNVSGARGLFDDGFTQSAWRHDGFRARNVLAADGHEKAAQDRPAVSQCREVVWHALP
jgi:hypothetical protein